MSKCYNSELPIGPPGPQGPPGDPATCCVERILNDTTTTALEGVLNTQVLNLSLSQNGEFIEVNFDTSFVGINDFSSLIIDLNGYKIADIAKNDDISGRYQGTIIITQSTSNTIDIKSTVFGYTISSPIIDLYLSNNQYFKHKLDHVATPSNLVLTISTEPNVGSSILTTSKILKYNIPYL